MRILDLERRGWLNQAARDEAARELGLTAVQYAQILNRLIDREESLAYAPVTVNRLRRQRANVGSRLH